MFISLYQQLDGLLGLNQQNITLFNMILRILIIYFFGIVVLNLINKRFIGEKTPFDILLRFVIGSSLANAITGNSPYFQTVGMVLFIILLNWVLSYLSVYNIYVETLLKGKKIILYKDGAFQIQEMHRNHFTQEDIESEIRKNSGIENLADINKIFLENSGEISIIPKSLIKINNKSSDLDD